MPDKEGRFFMRRKRKTNKSVAKRFKITKSGKLKKAKAFKRHLLALKSKKRKRALRKANYCFISEAKNIKKLLPYS